MAVKIGASVEMTDRKAGEKDEQAIWAWGRLPACPIKCIASGRPTHASVVTVPCPCQVFFDNKERHRYTLRSLETVRDPCLASPVAAAPARTRELLSDKTVPPTSVRLGPGLYRAPQVRAPRARSRGLRGRIPRAAQGAYACTT